MKIIMLSDFLNSPKFISLKIYISHERFLQVSIALCNHSDSLPSRASEQGNVIGLVSVYIVVIEKNCN